MMCSEEMIYYLYNFLRADLSVSGYVGSSYFHFRPNGKNSARGVPDKELVINRGAHEDIYVVLRDTFDAAKRQLEDYERRRRGDIKSHENILHGHVTKIEPEGFGFIETPDGREFYFNRANVAHPSFEKLEVGNEVQFLEEVGGQRLQAKRVSIGKHHYPG